MTYTDKTKATKPQVFAQITEKMANVYTAKNHDYGNAFSKSVKEFGIIAAVVRMNDKMERIKELSKLPQDQMKVKSESIEDTLLDLANYAVMTLVEMKTM